MNLDGVRAEKCRRSLYEFTRQMWPYIDPAPFVPGWHLEAMAEHLEAVKRGEIRRLLITIPPRHMKSLLLSVAFPAWWWADDPTVRFLFASYAQSLSVRDSRKCRSLIKAPLYQDWFGHRFDLRRDQDSKMRFENTSGGARLATAVEGSLTGEGGDVIAVDDPHNVQEVESQKQREAVCHWWDEAMSTRLNDPRTGRMIVMQQRTHQGDLAGHILEGDRTVGEWDILNLPAEYEGEGAPTSIGWRDPRRSEGELLWPERFPREEVDRLKRSLGSYGAAAQLQQRPAPKEGGVVNMAWFRRYREAPAHVDKVVISIDTAYKPQDLRDPSVAGVWYCNRNGYYLVEVWRDRVGYPDLKRTVRNIASRYRANEVLIEDKGSGTSLIQDLQEPDHDAEAMPQIPVIPIDPGKQDKVIRMETEAPTVEAGNVWLPEEAPWLYDFERELRDFPNSEHDDQVDMLSQFLKRQRDPSPINI